MIVGVPLMAVICDVVGQLIFYGMVKYNGQMYTYVHNLQGDIVAILDSSGAKVVEYRYDAWGRDIGRTLTSNIGELNPFRYRGYVYDEETGLYYLRSRYYNAEMGKFIRGDIIIPQALLDKNSFAYCRNNPLSNADNSGHATYKVILNIYDKNYSEKNDWGHYDVTFVEIGDDGKETAKTTVSYGPQSTTDPTAIVTVYKGGHEGKTPCETYTVYDDITENEMKEFRKWFKSDFADGTSIGTHKVLRKSEFKTYSFNENRKTLGVPDQHYCGSATFYWLMHIRQDGSNTSKRVEALYYVMIRRPVFYTAPGKNSDRALTKLRGWF